MKYNKDTKHGLCRHCGLDPQSLKLEHTFSCSGDGGCSSAMMVKKEKSTDPL